MDKEVITSIKKTIKNWWVFLIIGILMIVGSIWMFKTPVESFIGLAGFFSILILMSGILSVFYVMGNKRDLDNWGLYLTGGILDIVMGFILLSYPKLTLILFALFIGFWLLFRGISTVSAAFKYKKDGEEGWGWMMFFGFLIVIFAIMSIINPIIGAAYLVFTLAFAFLMLGAANIFLAFNLKNVKGRMLDLNDDGSRRIEE